MERNYVQQTCSNELSRSPACPPGAAAAITPASMQPEAAICTVVKRDGSIVPFVPDRIVRSVENVFRAEYAIPASAALPQQAYSAVHHVSQQVMERLLSRRYGGRSPTTAEIQDLVERTLVQHGYHDIARRYVAYGELNKLISDDSPRNLKVLQQDGKSSAYFNPMKIASAIELAFRASYAARGLSPQTIAGDVNSVTQKAVARVREMALGGAKLSAGSIQDELERQLMIQGHYEVAKNYILSRAQRLSLQAQAQLRPAVPLPRIRRRQILLEAINPGRVFTVADQQGRKFVISEQDLRLRIDFACRTLEGVHSRELLEEALNSLHEHSTLSDLDAACILAARARIQEHQNYSYVAARLLLDVIYREALGVEANSPEVEPLTRRYFPRYVDLAIQHKQLDPKLECFDITRLANSLVIQRDLLFRYEELHTLYNDHLLQSEQQCLETPQIMWMRIAMSFALNETAQRNEHALQFYNVLSKYLSCRGGPELFAAGRLGGSGLKIA